MAQNVEELAEILSRLQEENKINSEDVTRILGEIKQKVDTLGNENDEHSLIIDGIKNAFDLKSNVDIEKFSEFSDSLSRIKNILSESISSDDYNRFLETVRSLEANFQQAVSGLAYDKQNFFEQIQSEIGRIVEKSVILSDLFPQKEQEMLNAVSNEIKELIQNTKEDINGNIKNDFNSVAQGIGGLLARIESLKSEVVKNGSDNSSGVSEEVKASVSNFAKQLDELKSILNKNFEDNTQVISTLNDANLKVTSLLSDSEKNIHNNVDTLRKNIEDLFNKTDEIKSDLKKSAEENLNKILERINENSNHIFKFKENVSGHLTDYLTSIKELFISFTEDVKSGQETLSSDIFDKKLNELETLSKDINSLEVNLTLKEDSYKTYLAGKVSELQEFIIDFNENNKPLSEENFQKLNQNIEELTRIIDTLASSTNVHFAESISEITEIKEYIANTSVKIDYLQNNTTANTDKIDNLKDTLSNQLNNVNTKLYSLSDDLKSELSKGSGASDELKEEINTNINGNFNEVKTILECLRASNSQCSDNLTNKVDEFENKFSDHNEIISGKVDFVSSKTDEQTHSLSEIKELLFSISNEITNTQNSITEMDMSDADKKIILEQSLVSKLKDAEERLIEKNSIHSNEVYVRIEEVKNHISSVKIAVADLHSENNGKLVDKLFSIESKLSDMSDDYEQNLSMLQAKLGEYVLSVDKISTETNLKLDSSVNEFLDIKNELNHILEHVSSTTDGQTQDFATKLSELVSKFDDVSENISQFKDDVKSDVKEALNENINFIDKGLGYLTVNLDEIKSKQSENYDIITNTLSDKIADIKQEIELVNTDVINALNLKSEAFVNEFNPMKQAVDKFLEFDFAAVISEIKSQVELSYLNLLSELNNNLIENHDAYIRIENTYKDIVSRCTSLEDYINGFTKDNLELINSSIANIDLTVRSTLDKTNSFLAEWHEKIDSIEEKIENSHNKYESSITRILEDAQTSISTKIDASGEELKGCLALLLNNEDLMLAIESTNNDLSCRIEEFKASFDDNGENLKSISEQFETFTSENDKNNVNLANAIKLEIGNILSTINEKFESCETSNTNTINETSAKIMETISSLHNKVDILATEDSTELHEEIISTIQSLHSKMDILALEDGSGVQEILDEISEILQNQQASIEKNSTGTDNAVEMLKVLHEKVDILAAEDNSEVQDILDEISEMLQTQQDSIDRTSNGTDNVADMLKVLHEKVDVLAMADNSDLRDEIDDIKNLIYEQRKLFEELGDNEKAHEIDSYLNDLLAEINKIEKGVSEIDLDKNAQDIKDSVMTAILSVTDQISFVEETEEIKDFVEEKTNAINKTLLDVKKQLSSISSNNGDMDLYSYTLQDVESDIAKLRLTLNDMTSSTSFGEVGVISSNINRIAKSIEDLHSTVIGEENSEFKTDLGRLSEDILSLSTRTNKLILNSDESCRIVCETLDEFNKRTSTLEDRLNIIDNSNIEDKLALIDEKVNENISSDKVLKNVMMYLGEWMDGTTETISSIYEKTNKVSYMQEALDELKETVPDKEALINTIEEKFEEQQNRIDRLEKKLEKVASIIEAQDDNLVLNKIDKLETQLEKLSLNIEKLASYVDE